MMAGEKDTEYLDAVGLGDVSMMQTLGSVCAENFDKILTVLESSESTPNPATRAHMANQLKTWSFIVPADVKQQKLTPNMGRIISLIEKLSVTTGDDSLVNDCNEYIGSVFVAFCLIELISQYISMDFSYELAKVNAPLAFTALENILVASEKDREITFTTRAPPRFSDNAGDYRAQIASALLRTMPCMGSVDLPNGLKVIAKILVPQKKFPMVLQNDARSSMSLMTLNCKSIIENSGHEIIEIVKAGGNDSLLMSFVSMPELYKNCPEAVENNLEIFMKQPYMMYATVFNNVSNNKPEILIPHLQFFIDQLTTNANMGSSVLGVLEAIAKIRPSLIYPKVNLLVEKTRGVPMGTMILAKVLSATGKESSKAADEMTLILVDLLETTTNDQYAAPGLLFAISNLMSDLSDPEILAKQMPRIAKFKSASEVVFTSINDYAAG
jgi:hypothetical protein